MSTKARQACFVSELSVRILPLGTRLLSRTVRYAPVYGRFEPMLILPIVKPETPTAIR